MPNNINDTFFDGHYKDIWKTIIPEILTIREIDFLISYFNLQPGNQVLDLMCGYGRHALALARKGIAVTAVDNLPAYIHEIITKAEEEKLPVQAVQQNVVGFIPRSAFTLAICMGNSLNFFNASDVQKIFRNIAPSLEPGGHFIINSWSIAEIVFRNFKETSEGTLGDAPFASTMKIFFQPTRVEVESEFTPPGGEKEFKKGIDYIYSLNELETMLNEAGFRLKKVYSIPGKKEFTIGEPRAYIIAEKS